MAHITASDLHPYQPEAGGACSEFLADKPKPVSIWPLFLIAMSPIALVFGGLLLVAFRTHN